MLTSQLSKVVPIFPSPACLKRLCTTLWKSWSTSIALKWNREYPKKYFSWQPCGGFLKWWYPQNTPKWSFLVGKPPVVGYHHFSKAPCKFLSLLRPSSHHFCSTCSLDTSISNYIRTSWGVWFVAISLNLLRCKLLQVYWRAWIWFLEACGTHSGGWAK